MDAASPARDAALPVDGSPVAPPDGGVVALDAGPPRPTCPAPCQGDAYADFSDIQGGSNGRWRYVEFHPESASSSYFFMSADPVGWTGTGPTPPSISKCETTDGTPPRCLGLFETVALETASPGLGVHHPALMWTAPEAGDYYLFGTLRVASTSSEAPITLRITRNSIPLEILYAETVSLTTTPYVFETVQFVEAGEGIVLSVIAAGDIVSVGVNFFLSGPVAPSRGGSW